MNDYPATRAEAAAAVAAIADADADLAATRRGLRAVEAEAERMTDEIVLAGKLDGKNEQIRAAQLRTLLAAEPGYLRLVELRTELEQLTAERTRDRERTAAMLRILLRDMDYVTLRESEERKERTVQEHFARELPEWTKDDLARRFAAQKDPYEDGEGR